MALLSVIILGLVAMFNQTRRAFTSSLTQVDVLEAGRAAADLIAREVEQLAPSGYGFGTNFYVDTASVYLSDIAMPLTQKLVDPNDVRTNTIQDFYFLTTSYSPSHNLQWNIIGYKISTPSPYNGIGSLYRYAFNNISPATLSAVLLSNVPPWKTFLATDPTGPAGTNFSRIMDGVVDFRIRAYDPNGNLFGSTNKSTFIVQNYPAPFLDNYYYEFNSNSIPAYVEIELGVVEDRTLARYQALTNSLALPSPALTYLANHPGQVHIFRQRISIRNVNPAAYQ